MKLLLLFLLVVSPLQSGGILSRSICCLQDTVIIQTIQENTEPDLEDLTYESEEDKSAEAASCCSSTQEHTEQEELEDILAEYKKRKKRSCCSSTCTKVIIGTIGLSALAVPAILQIVAFINDIKDKAQLVQESCIKMDNHCSEFDRQCTILGSQVQLLIELLSRITRITPQQVICIVTCTKDFSTIIEQLACIANCFKA